MGKLKPIHDQGILLSNELELIVRNTYIFLPIEIKRLKCVATPNFQIISFDPVTGMWIKGERGILATRVPEADSIIQIENRWSNLDINSLKVELRKLECCATYPYPENLSTFILDLFVKIGANDIQLYEKLLYATCLMLFNQNYSFDFDEISQQIVNCINLTSPNLSQLEYEDPNTAAIENLLNLADLLEKNEIIHSVQQ